MKFLTATLATVILLMTGCTQNNETELLSVPLSFFTKVDTQTRVTDLTTDNLTSMGVFAYFSRGDFNASTAIPDFMYNQEVKRTNASVPWTYSPVKYWPNNTKDKVSFFAYASHNAVGVTTSANNETGYPSLTYTMPSTVAEQIDLLISNPSKNMNMNGGNINFELKHALAKVSFYVKNGDATPGKKVQAFSVQARSKGTYTFNETGFVYSAADNTEQVYSITTPVDIPANTTNKVLLETLFIHPDKETNFSFTYSINGNDANKVETLRQQLPDTPALVSGANISYTITVNKDGYTIAAADEKGWTQGSESEITYYAPNDLKVGDYYYSDGTWSDGGLTSVDEKTKTRIWKSPLPDPNLVNPETNVARQCIGVVFATEKDAVVTDPTSVKAMVVSPKDEKRTQCYPDLTATTANFPPPAGALSSGWFHPDEKTLRWMAKGDGATATYLREILDDHLTKITDGAILAGEYWVSPFTIYGATRYVMNLSSGSYYVANYLQSNVGFRGVLNILK